MGLSRFSLLIKTDTSLAHYTDTRLTNILRNLPFRILPGSTAVPCSSLNFPSTCVLYGMLYSLYILQVISSPSSSSCRQPISCPSSNYPYQDKQRSQQQGQSVGSVMSCSNLRRSLMSCPTRFRSAIQRYHQRPCSFINFRQVCDPSGRHTHTRIIIYAYAHTRELPMQ